MLKPTEDPWIPEDNPAIVGPDYVALVIEWDEEEQTQVSAAPVLKFPRALAQVAGAIVGAIGVIALGAWGIHRLRA